MRIELTSTDKIVELARPDGGTMPARVWRGYSASGVPVLAFITRLAAEVGHNLEEFEAQLTSHGPPDLLIDSIPARLLIGD